MEVVAVEVGRVVVDQAAEREEEAAAEAWGAVQTAVAMTVAGSLAVVSTVEEWRGTVGTAVALRVVGAEARGKREVHGAAVALVAVGALETVHGYCS